MWQLELFVDLLLNITLEVNVQRTHNLTLCEGIIYRFIIKHHMEVNVQCTHRPDPMWQLELFVTYY